MASKPEASDASKPKSNATDDKILEEMGDVPDPDEDDLDDLDGM